MSILTDLPLCRHFGLMNVLDAPSAGSAKIPALLFALYQARTLCTYP